jgi:predicted nucleic acid-binding protein
VKIYLDTSVYNLPFDDQTQPRIWLETLAVAIILQYIESGEAVLINSSVLEFENSRNPFSLRRDWMKKCLRLSKEYRLIDDANRKRAQQLEAHGVKAMDALHVACAESADADFFLTCDKRLLKKQKNFKVKSINPLDFVQKVIGEIP